MQDVVTDVPAARHVLGILTYLSRQPRPAPASAIARDLGLPRSTTYHLLTELIAAGYVVHLADDRRYGLGVSAYELGTGYVRQEPLQRLARVPLSELTDATGHSSHLAVMQISLVWCILSARYRGGLSSRAMPARSGRACPWRPGLRKTERLLFPVTAAGRGGLHPSMRSPRIWPVRRWPTLSEVSAPAPVRAVATIPISVTTPGRTKCADQELRSLVEQQGRCVVLHCCRDPWLPQVAGPSGWPRARRGSSRSACRAPCRR